MYQIIAGMVSRVGSITAIYAKSAVNALSRVFDSIFYSNIPSISSEAGMPTWYEPRYEPQYDIERSRINTMVDAVYQEVENP